MFKDYPPLGEALPPELAQDIEHASFAPLSASVTQQPFTQSEYGQFTSPLTPQTPSTVAQQGHAPLATPLQAGFAQHPVSLANYSGYPAPAAGYPRLPSWLQSAHSDASSGSPSGRPIASSAHGYGLQHGARSLGNHSWPPPMPATSAAQWVTTAPPSLDSPPDPLMPAPATSSDLHLSYQPQIPASTADVRYGAFLPGLVANGATGMQEPSQASWFQRPDHNAVLEMAAVEMEDDDYYDVLPEEEVYSPGEVSPSYDINKLRHVKAITTRSHPGFYSNMAFYNESHAASPLKNPATQLIFKNFIWHTAPTLSICERPSPWALHSMPQGGMTGKPMSCWMDVLPLLAMKDSGLLHAMLAQSSFEIAKSHGASTTSSMKHHVWSMKRVHRALDSPRKRHSVTTLAATLLLGFYEILTADHMKWSTHLSGARHLIMETNFRGMTDELRRRSRTSSADYSHQPTSALHEQPPDSLHNLCDADEPLVEQVMGFRVGPSPEQDQRHRHVNADVEYYATRQDLFWWYCKQDAYHSVISGNDLL